MAQREVLQSVSDPEGTILTISQVVVRITIIVALTELVIMLVLETLAGHLNPRQMSLFDTVFLILVSTPLIYYWVIRPFMRAHQAAMAKITHMACHDMLTDLPNRRLVYEILEKRVSETARHGETVALLYIDLDGFKEINDAYGHAAGDSVLLRVAARLKDLMRREDTVSRVGGDEFVVVMCRLPADEAEANAAVEATVDKIRELVGKPIFYEGLVLEVGASIGVRLVRAEKVVADTLMKEADIAMLSDKKHRHARSGAQPPV